MAHESSIEWCNSTWNPVVGCTKVSPGCAHCYAEVMAARLKTMALADIAAGRNPGRKRHYIDAIDDKGRWSGKLIPVPEALADPIRWRKPRMVFVNSMSDLFHESVPFEFVDRVFAVMNATTHRLPIREDLLPRWHTYQVLTKRPERMVDYLLSRHPRNFAQGKHPIFLAGCGEDGILRGHGREVMNAGSVPLWPLPNVWLGTSVEDQKRADERIPHLLRCPAAVRFLSAEPLLGPVDLSGWMGDYGSLQGGPHVGRRTIDWIIIGCESGHNRRPMRQEWASSLVEQCRAAGVVAFVKQVEVGGKVCHDPAEWPEGLRVRQFPEVAR